jgi:hypothetical protein
MSLFSLISGMRVLPVVRRDNAQCQGEVSAF